MCQNGCATKLNTSGGSTPCACTVQLENTPESVISWVVDNNETAVRRAMMNVGIDPSGLTKRELKKYLMLSYSMGYDISFIDVPYNNEADNYTGGLSEEMFGTSGKGNSEEIISAVIGAILGGVSAYYGSGVFMGSGNNNNPPAPEPSKVPVWAYAAGGFMLLLLIIVLVKR